MTAIAEYAIYRTTIDQIMQGDERLPSLPVLTMKIRKASSDENITIPRLSSLIARDPSLVVQIMRHANSPLYRTQQSPKSLDDAIRLLGIPCVDSLVMLHSIKSLFTIKNPKLKQLFNATWKRQTIKAAMSLFLARKLGLASADEALVASLLSEVGTLAILSALTEVKNTPDPKTYYILCRQYSKSLGSIILKKWNLGNHYSDVIKHCGDWATVSNKAETHMVLSITDIINLALYHCVALTNKEHNLPPLEQLSVFYKLPVSFNLTTREGLLTLITENLGDIAKTANNLH